MPGLMEKLFGAKPAETVPAPGAPGASTPTPGQQPAPNNPNDPTPPGAIPPNTDIADPLVPAEGNPDATKAEETNSPLEPFKKLWETKPVKEGEDEPSAPEALKPEDVQAIVAKQDFISMVPKEDMAAVVAGGEGAEEALGKVLQSVIQNVMVQSTLIGNKLTTQAVTAAIEAQAKKIPEMLREGRAADHLVTEHPLINHPAIKPVADAARTALLAQNPNASASEITQMTNDYITAMADQIKPRAKVDTSVEGDYDWSNFDTD